MQSLKRLLMQSLKRLKMKQLDELIVEIKETKVIMTDMAKDIKDMKTFVHALCNKLSGMI